MEFRILGPLEVADDRPLPLGGPKQRAVLAELLLRANRAVTRSELVDALWGESPPKTALGTLQVYVHELRRALGSERIETAGGAYRIRLAESELDLDRFRLLVDRGRDALAAHRPADAAADLESALALWRGPALADLTSLPSTHAAARELDERRVEAVELLNEARLELGRHELVLPELEQLIADHPYRELLRRQQILALYRAGRQTDALEAYRAAREAWLSDLGLEPTPALRELERAVLRHDPSLAAPARPPSAPTRLPVPPTPLVGRLLEIAAVAALLRADTRLVTLVGPGGAGKTRLAVAVAAELAAESRDGAVFVDLSPISDPGLLLPAVAQSLGVDAEEGRVGEALHQHLRDRAPLLVLDNLEQLLPSVVAVAELLAASPRLRVIATSRAPLRLSGEHVYPVPPLPLPAGTETLEELSRNEAVRLFVARARAVEPSFVLDETNAEIVAAICRRLDGLPLALELAAARSALLTPEEILDRLEPQPVLAAVAPRDVPVRQRTLAATIQWSYDLLADGVQAVFPRLAVFSGGFTREAAEHVCGIDIAVLASLVENSLVQTRDAGRERRFALLETVRRFALERLPSNDGTDVRHRHAQWLTDLAERAELRIVAGEDAAAWLDRLESEHDNFRAALGWAIESASADVALRLASSLRSYWEVRGHLAEGARWLEQALSLDGGGDPSARAKALGAAGTVAFRRGDVTGARDHFADMLQLARRIGDAEGIARGLSDVGTMAAAVGDFDRARKLLDESAERFRGLREDKRLSVVLGNLGHVAAQLGDYDEAIAVTTEALALQRELGDKQRQAISLYNLGSFSLDRGDPAGARRRLSDCLELSLELNYREVIAYALAAWTRISLLEGDVERAACLAGIAERLLDEIGAELQDADRAAFETAKDTAREQLGDAAYFAAANRDDLRPDLLEPSLVAIGLGLSDR